MIGLDRTESGFHAMNEFKRSYCHVSLAMQLCEEWYDGSIDCTGMVVPGDALLADLRDAGGL